MHRENRESCRERRPLVATRGMCSAFRTHPPKARRPEAAAPISPPAGQAPLGRPLSAAAASAPSARSSQGSGQHQGGDSLPRGGSGGLWPAQGTPGLEEGGKPRTRPATHLRSALRCPGPSGRSSWFRLLHQSSMTLGIRKVTRACALECRVSGPWPQSESPYFIDLPHDSDAVSMRTHFRGPFSFCDLVDY